MTTEVEKKLELYTFQREDVERMKDMPNVLLFSECGLGKTIVAITHVSEQELYPTLVICPTSLKLNWYDEIEKWTGEQPFYADNVSELVEGYFANLKEYLDYVQQDNGTTPEVKKLKWFIIHHEALAYVYEDDPVRQMIMKIKWKSVCVDEAHRFRSPGTYRTSTLMNMNKEGTKYVFITGTPIVNSTFDLFPMLKIMGKAEDEDRFIDKYTIGRKSQWGYQIIASKNKDQLLAELAPIYIRRTKAEDLKGLPPKQYQTVKLTMPEDQREVYNHMEQLLAMELDDGESLTSPNVLSLITRLRQLSLDPTILGRATNSSKTKAVLELIEQSPEEKWVVASTSKKFVHLLASKIPNSLTYTGDDKPGYERYQKEQQFKNNAYRKVLLMTMFTGGLGLNLQVANNIIITDNWFNKVAVDQQIDRLHRIGQMKRVMVYTLHNERSIDDDMAKRVATKERMANEIVVKQDLIKDIYARVTGHDYVQPPKMKDTIMAPIPEELEESDE